MPHIFGTAEMLAQLKIVSSHLEDRRAPLSSISNPRQRTRVDLFRTYSAQKNSERDRCWATNVSVLHLSGACHPGDCLENKRCEVAGQNSNRLPADKHWWFARLDEGENGSRHRVAECPHHSGERMVVHARNCVDDAGLTKELPEYGEVLGAVVAVEFGGV